MAMAYFAGLDVSAKETSVCVALSQFGIAPSGMRIALELPAREEVNRADQSIK